MTESKEVNKKRDVHAKLVLCSFKSISFLTDILVAIALVVVWASYSEIKPAVGGFLKMLATIRSRKYMLPKRKRGEVLKL